MATTITLEFPDLPGDLNEAAVAMGHIRKSMLANGDACREYSGHLVSMSGPETREDTETTASLSVTIGVISFPKEK